LDKKYYYDFLSVRNLTSTKDKINLEYINYVNLILQISYEV